jgi:mRNA-degrading endonuclease RelE of RelBE toxin-antitoxin system
MDKIEKALRKFSEGERKKIKEILSDLQKFPWKKNLDIKKLKGRNDIYRVRKGDIRIIFRLFKKKVFVIKIGRRKSSTYK